MENTPKEDSNPWREAVLDACCIASVDFHHSNPVKTLAGLIQHQVDTALDPQVSGRARDLMTLGADEQDDEARRWRKLMRLSEAQDELFFDRLRETLARMGIAEDTPLIARDFIVAFDVATDGVPDGPLTGLEVLDDGGMGLLDAH